MKRVKKSERVQKAAKSYIRRKYRLEHPVGDYDKGGRWVPAEEERCSLCGGERTRSMAWPYTLSQHCRTVEHVAMRHGVPSADVLRAVRKLEKSGNGRN